MKEKFKEMGSLNFSQELSRNEQKKILGGSGGGRRCHNSQMNCTSSPINSGYCSAVWPASGGQVDECSLP